MRKYDLRRDTIDERDYKFSIKPHESVVLPQEIDLRNLCPPIYDQGQQGSCTANAGCAARSMLLVRPDLMLSRAFLYYESRVLEGTTQEDSGATLRTLCKATQLYGVCEEPYMPYVDEDYRTAPTENAVANAIQYKIKAYTRMLSLDEIKKSLALNQTPVILGMMVYESMETETVAATGILPMPKVNEAELGGHAVLAVGYIDPKPIVESYFFKLVRKTKKYTPGYLIIRNSWGEAWGDKGYFYMPYEYFNKYTFDYWTFS